MVKIKKLITIFIILFFPVKVFSYSPLANLSQEGAWLNYFFIFIIFYSIFLAIALIIKMLSNKKIKIKKEDDFYVDFSTDNLKSVEEEIIMGAFNKKKVKKDSMDEFIENNK